MFYPSPSSNSIEESHKVTLHFNNNNIIKKNEVFVLETFNIEILSTVEMIRTTKGSRFGYKMATTRIFKRLLPTDMISARCSLSSTYSSDAYGCSPKRNSGGAGVGDVEDKMLPSAFDDNTLFKYCTHPRTASIIG